MATPTKPATTATDPTDLAQQVREQLLATVQQGQRLAVDATQTWVKAFSALPTPALPSIPGAPDLPSAEAVTTYTFDIASDLLAAQREFAVQLAALLTPAKTA